MCDSIIFKDYELLNFLERSKIHAESGILE